jgi:hypothetical protein
MKLKKLNNYAKLALLLIGVILLTIIASNIYKNNERNKANKSYIADYVSCIKYEDVKSAIVEFSSNTILYVSYKGDKNIYDFEKEIKPIVKKNESNFNFVYVDASSLLKTDNYFDSLNASLSLKENTIKKLPAIVYYKDNTATDYIDSYNHLINKGDFEELLDKYELSGSKQ